MMMSNEDYEMIKKFEQIYLRGNYVNSQQLQDVYNRIFKVNLNPTQCGSCIRQRCQQLIDAMHTYERELEAAKERSKPQEKDIKEIENKPKKKVGRPKKTE